MNFTLLDEYQIVEMIPVLFNCLTLEEFQELIKYIGSISEKYENNPELKAKLKQNIISGSDNIQKISHEKIIAIRKVIYQSWPELFNK